MNNDEIHQESQSETQFEKNKESDDDDNDEMCKEYNGNENGSTKKTNIVLF